MTQKERQERSKTEIYHAALEEFGTKDYGSVTVDGICEKYGISKGMMYHYYKGKDALFLLCVGRVFQELQKFLINHLDDGPHQGCDAIEDYFLCRERFFQENPRQRTVFETAIIRPPAHLEKDIQELRGPMREYNRHFLGKVLSQLRLRDSVTQEEALHYLDAAEGMLFSMIRQLQPEVQDGGLLLMEKSARKMLDIMLFGIAREGHWQQSN